MIEKFEEFETPDYLNAAGKYRFKITAVNVQEKEVKGQKEKSQIAVVDCETVEKTPKITTLRFDLTKSKEGRVWGKIFYGKLIKAAATPARLEKIAQEGIDFLTIGKSLVGKEFYGEVEEVEGKEDPLTGEKKSGKVFYNINTGKLSRVNNDAE